MTTEADTCRKYVVPNLDAAGWDTPPHSYTEQRTFTDGRIVLAGMRPIDDTIRTRTGTQDRRFPRARRVMETVVATAGINRWMCDCVRGCAW